MRLFFTSLLLFACIGRGDAQSDSVQRLNFHFQTTYIYQYKPSFHSEYEGPHSLLSKEEKENSLTATAYIGIKLWKGGALYINPELAGGSGLSGAFGLSSSTNGETFRVGNPAPTLYLARGYYQQTFTLDNDKDWAKNVNGVPDGANQLRGIEPANYFRWMIGKFCLADIFDYNPYSASPRTQFMNWSLMNNAAWDYAANVRGYTYAAALIAQYNKMNYKLALATLPTEANGPELNTDMSQAYAINAEVVRSYEINKLAGHWRILAYYNNANMGNYAKSLIGYDTTSGPDVALTRISGRTKTGIGINIDQQVDDNVGLFFRYGRNDGNNETWCYTEADKTYSLGIMVSGNEWSRSGDNIGFAVVVNHLSQDHKDYLKAGGMGFELGDGRLSYGGECASELFYQYKIPDKGIWLAADYQFIINPGYNKDRGPGHVFSFRMHVEL